MLKKDRLPDWFEYPPEFLRIIDLRLMNLDPWHILEGDMLEDRFNGISERFSDKCYIPFAYRSDNDDVACWSKEGGNEKVLVIHDFASSGWEQVKTYNSFWSWFKQTIEDMIEHEQPYR
ncbi:MAG: hypothetical protein ACOH5I_24515 [Oligoflexus sp.]